MLKPKQVYSLERVVEKTKDLLFIVEGKKDKKVLFELGIRHILPISGKSLENIAEYIGAENWKSVVILTDFDRDGKKKAEKLEKLLQSYVLIERATRRFFKSLKIAKIEELKGVAKLVNSRSYDKEINKRFFSKRRKRKLR